jgi:orotidine-5'-phosphate decarboxylase
MEKNKRLISRDKSIIIACDVPLDKFGRLVKSTHNLSCVGGYKIGTALALEGGLETVVDLTRIHTQKPLIYDHQKAGTDIPSTAKRFMKVLSNAGVDAVILFPLSGPATQTSWTDEAQMNGIHVIVGGHMTHPMFSKCDGGHIDITSSEKMYTLAAEQGVQSFVVPGNKPEVITRVRSLLPDDAVLYSPGLITQGGKISEAGKAAGNYWNAIIGSAIYTSDDPVKSIIDMWPYKS